jgi:hypothetical protein
VTTARDAEAGALEPSTACAGIHAAVDGCPPLPGDRRNVDQGDELRSVEDTLSRPSCWYLRCAPVVVATCDRCPMTQMPSVL